VTEGEGRKVAGRYLLGRILGSGGMGRVWQARDEYLHRDVAIKEVAPRGTFVGGESDPVVRRTLREARAAAALRHSGIVTVHDVVTDDGRPWIVMELIKGRSLADTLSDDGPLSVHQAAEIGIKVIEALDAAHQQGVLHRDVKPGNIMLDGDRVVLTDFGIAVIAGATTALTGTGQLIGSPEYISPERINGHEADRAADLWAVGVTLYGMVVGRTPFHRTDATATLGAIVAKEPDPAPAVGALWPVIQGLLRKKPAERLTATAAVALLREVVGTPAVQAPATPWLPSLPGGPTRIQFQQSQVTVENVTEIGTRPTMPPPAPIPSVGGPVMPWDVTIDAVQSRPPRKPKIGIYVAVAAFLAIVITVVLIATSNHGTSGIAQPPLPTFQTYKEAGFSIEVPRDYLRQASNGSASSDVVWQAVQRDPRVGTLQVQVRLDDSHPGTRPIDYLSTADRTESADPNVVGYQRVALTGQANGPAELEYTYGSQPSGEQVHVRSRAVAGGQHLYVLTFTLNAQDTTTLRGQWQSLQPIMVKIRDNFQLTP
jgi:serine/threonine protein kinase